MDLSSTSSRLSRSHEGVFRQETLLAICKYWRRRSEVSMISVKNEHAFPEDTLDLLLIPHWISFVQVRVTAAVATSAAKRFRIKLVVLVAMLRVSTVHYANISCDRTHHGSASRQGTCPCHKYQLSAAFTLLPKEWARLRACQ
jgi:hypothetical protein